MSKKSRREEDGDVEDLMPPALRMLPHKESAAEREEAERAAARHGSRSRGATTASGTAGTS
jgi:hypothetical protein